MEGHSHDAVSQVKGFLYAVTMVNVYVDVQNPRVVSGTHRGYKERDSKRLVNVLQRRTLLLEKLQYTDDDVIYVTKPRRLQTQKNLFSPSTVHSSMQ